MSNAKKCDRCGTLYEIKFDADRPAYNGQKIRRFALITADITGPEERYGYDLCPDCARALMSWFSSGEDNKKEDISEEPDIRDTVHDMVYNLLG